MNVYKRSWLYRLWVLLGLPAVVAVVVYSALNEPPGSTQPEVVGGIAVGVWMVGLLALQWSRLLRDQRSGRDPLGARANDLALGPRDPKVDQQLWRFTWLGMLYLTALVVAVIVAGLLLTNGKGDDTVALGGWECPVVVLPILGLALIGVIRVPFKLAKAYRLSDAALNPLGLQITERPQSVILPQAAGGFQHHLVGATVMEGVRHGRRVRADFTPGASRVLVAAPVPDFEVVAQHDRLQALGPAPAFVSDTLAGLPAHQRNRGLRVRGVNGMIICERDRGGTDHWTDDLWLAELLAGAL